VGTAVMPMPIGQTRGAGGDGVDIRTPSCAFISRAGDDDIILAGGDLFMGRKIVR
jgi:hypothetical protein